MLKVKENTKVTCSNSAKKANFTGGIEHRGAKRTAFSHN